MKKQLIIIMILLLGVVINLNAQSEEVGKSKDHVINKLYHDRLIGEIDNIKIYDTYVKYDLVYKHLVYGNETIWFKYDYCYSYKTYTLSKFYQEFLDGFNKRYGIPISNNIWIDKIYRKDIAYNTIYLLSSSNKNTIIEVYCFREDKEEEYLNFINSKIKKK